MRLRRVVGNSMLPTLVPNQIVIVIRPRQIQVGDVVIVLHNNLEKIKRVAKKEAGKVYILGDNSSESTDSRTFGWLNEDTIVGKVIWPRARRSVQ